MNYWGQRDDESVRWFFRFWLYLALGYDRTLLRAYKCERRGRRQREGLPAEDESLITSLPNSWQLAIKRYQWRERAMARDLYRLGRLQQTVQQQFAQSDSDTLAALIATQPVLVRKLARMVEMLDPDDADARTLARILEAAERLFVGIGQSSGQDSE